MTVATGRRRRRLFLSEELEIGDVKATETLVTSYHFVETGLSAKKKRRGEYPAVKRTRARSRRTSGDEVKALRHRIQSTLCDEFQDAPESAVLSSRSDDGESVADVQEMEEFVEGLAELGSLASETILGNKVDSPVASCTIKNGD